jgi:hypothetical protein
MIFIASNLIRPKQLRLNELFSVERVLASRGFEVEREGCGEDTLVSRNSWTGQEAALVFQTFNDSSNRKELLEYVEGRAQPTAGAPAMLTRIDDFVRDRQAFDKTFEWYVGELLVQKFQAFSSSYGVHVKHVERGSGIRPAGDYDVLSVLGDTSLMYVECKTGKFDRNKIMAMVERSHALHCAASVMFIDREFSAIKLRETLKDVVYPGHAESGRVISIAINGVSDSQVFAWHDSFFVNAGASSGAVEPKLRTALRVTAARKVELLRGLGISEEDYSRLGYQVDTL